MPQENLLSRHTGVSSPPHAPIWRFLTFWKVRASRACVCRSHAASSWASRSHSPHRSARRPLRNSCRRPSATAAATVPISQIPLPLCPDAPAAALCTQAEWAHWGYTCLHSCWTQRTAPCCSHPCCSVLLCSVGPPLSSPPPLPHAQSSRSHTDQLEAIRGVPSHSPTEIPISL